MNKELHSGKGKSTETATDFIDHHNHQQQKQLQSKEEDRDDVADDSERAYLLLQKHQQQQKPQPSQHHQHHPSLIHHYSIDCQEHPLLVREKHVSLEELNPHHECETRQSSISIAVINLVATICGGGVLSLPLAFARAGILPVTFMMVFGAIVTDFCIYLLVASARRTGGRTYGDVAEASFGKFAKIATTLTLIFMLFGVQIAYMVLIRDIWGGVIFSVTPDDVPALLSGTWRSNQQINERRAANVLLAAILVLALPLLLKKDLHELRHTCYVGFSSCVLLTLAVVYRALQHVLQLSTTNNLDGTTSTTVDYDDDLYDAASATFTHDNVTAATGTKQTSSSIRWYSTDPADLLFAFPIVMLCFFCSYNALPVHAKLTNPTRPRVRQVLDRSMVICFVLFYAIGLCGYLYAGEDTADNILLNFPVQDKAIFLGRSGYCFTLFFGLPLMVLPCREALLSIPGQIWEWQRDNKLREEFYMISERRRGGAHLIVNGVDFDDTKPHVIVADEEDEDTHGKSQKTRHGASLLINYGSTPDTSEETLQDMSVDGLDDKDLKNLHDPDHFSFQTQLRVTVVVLFVLYLAAIMVPGVAAVWSVCGSSIAILIAFIVPCGCYLKIREHKGMTVRAISAWGLLILFIIAAIVCTRQAVIDNLT